MNRYAMSDLHGQLDLILQARAYINDCDIIYVLGDAGDRGPEPWRTLKLCLADPQIVYLMGNHDLMLVKAMKEYIDLAIKEGADNVDLPMYYYGDSPISLLGYNGGLSTLEGWIEDPDRWDYYQQLKHLPLELRLAAEDGSHFIYLNHSGVHPSDGVWTAEDFVWDRFHFHTHWEDNGDIIIHGHTPVEIATDYLLEGSYVIEDNCLFYNNNHKIDIDIGACFNNKAALINIDTLKIKTFYTKGEDVDGAQSE